MAFPYDFHENFEGGNKGGFTTESDLGLRLDYFGPKQTLSGFSNVHPQHGAYCMRVNMGKNNTDAYDEKAVTWALDSVNYTRHWFMLGHDFQAGNVGDQFDVMTLISGASTQEGHVTVVLDDPAGLVIGLRDASGSVQGQLQIMQGDWICLETEVSVDAGGGNDGHIVLWTGNNRVKLSGLDQAAITAVRYGVMNQTGDFSGHVYFDDVIHDDGRLYPDMSPHNLSYAGKTMPFFKSGFAFIGSGEIDGATLIDGGSGNCTLKIFDTDDLAYAQDMLKSALSTTSNNQVSHTPSANSGSRLFEVEYGCYVLMTGTNPSALLRIGRSGSDLVEEEVVSDPVE